MVELSMSIREFMIKYIKEKKIPEDITTKQFISYLDAYCSELKLTKYDVLLNDDKYQKVYELFDFVVLKNMQL